MINIKENEDNTLTITFKNPIRAITPGQFIVFYNNKKEWKDKLLKAVNLLEYSLSLIHI